MSDDVEKLMSRRLEEERPIPSAGFRGSLRRRLIDAPGADPPPRLRALVAAYAGGGGLLLAILAAGILGVGPLAA